VTESGEALRIVACRAGGDDEDEVPGGVSFSQRTPRTQRVVRGMGSACRYEYRPFGPLRDGGARGPGPSGTRLPKVLAHLGRAPRVGERQEFPGAMSLGCARRDIHGRR